MSENERIICVGLPSDHLIEIESKLLVLTTAPPKVEWRRTNNNLTLGFEGKKQFSVGKMSRDRGTTEKCCFVVLIVLNDHTPIKKLESHCRARHHI